MTRTKEWLVGLLWLIAATILAPIFVLVGILLLPIPLFFDLKDRWT